MELIILDGVSACGKTHFARNFESTHRTRQVCSVHSNQDDSGAGYPNVLAALDSHFAKHKRLPMYLLLDRFFPCQHALQHPLAETEDIRETCQLWCDRLGAEALTVNLYIPDSTYYKEWLTARSKQLANKKSFALSLDVPSELRAWMQYKHRLNTALAVLSGTDEDTATGAPWTTISSYSFINKRS